MRREELGVSGHDIMLEGGKEGGKVSDEPEVFLPKYSQTAILHDAHFRRVVK